MNKPKSRNGIRFNRTLEQRFWERVTAGEPHQCWIWQGRMHQNGYGLIDSSKQFQADEKSKAIRAHRVSYEIHFGPIPEGLDIDHTCRHRNCVNPGHLRATTRSQNNENRSAIGINRSGVKNVYWNPQSEKLRWKVSVQKNGKQIHGGQYATVEEASVAARELRNLVFTHNNVDRTETEQQHDWNERT